METKAKTTDAVTPLETAGKALALEIAERGMALLKNDGVLPLAPCRLALYGAGARHTVKGGSGSGEVTARHDVSFYEGLKNAGFTVTTEDWLNRYDKIYAAAKQAFIAENKKKVRKIGKKTLAALMSAEFLQPDGDPVTEKDLTDGAADVCLYVLSRKPGEGHDERVAPGSYLLTNREQANIRFCAAHYRKFILVVNASFPLDLTAIEDCNIGAILCSGLAGMEGGTALANLLTGRSTPEGRLAVTWAKRYEDHPSAGCFATSPQVFYKEGTLVGYRYFTSVKKDVRFPFGFGLSYTAFQTEFLRASYENHTVRVRFRVTNTGKYQGRETVQIYAKKTAQRLFEESVRLATFGKTGLLQPGDSEELTLCVDPRSLSVFDEETRQTVIEEGAYLLCTGTDAARLSPAARVLVPDRIVLSDHSASFKREGRVHRPIVVENPDVPGLPEIPIDAVTFSENKRADEPIIKTEIPERELLRLLCGSGLFGEKTGFRVPGSVGHTTAGFLKDGVRNLEFCDGPAGLRLQRRSTVDKKGKIKSVDTAISLYDFLPELLRKRILGDPEKERLLYQFVTGFPTASLLAGTWAPELAEKMGEQVGLEMAEYGVDFWLAPAMNIVRDPLCGRNYEYYSEDPLLSGLFAANVCRGVQKTPGRYVTIKHFACNNQETERYFSSSELDEKTLREIYLKPFEIAVTDSAPKAVMAAYNKINGVYCAENEALIEGVLRGEWGFDGVVMTDWLATGKGQADECKAINAGVDLIMPGGKATLKALQKGYVSGALKVSAIKTAAARMLAIAKED